MLKIERKSKHVEDVEVDESQQKCDITQTTDTIYININIKLPISYPDENTERLCGAIEEVIENMEGKRELQSIGDFINECRNNSD